MTPLAFVIVVTDGSTLCTLHPAGLGTGPSAAVEAIVRDHLFGPDPETLPVAAGPPPKPAPAADSFLTQREIATGQGFTGDACPHCHAFAMLRAGTCLTCHACGSTTGCA